MSALYRFWLRAHNGDAWKCMQFQETPINSLMLLARKLFVDGEALFMAKLVDTAESKPETFGARAPTFTEAEKAQIAQDAEAATRGMDAMSGIREALGELYPEDGVLSSPQEYDEVKEALRQMKEQIIEQYANNDEERAEWEKSWPWDD